MLGDVKFCIQFNSIQPLTISPPFSFYYFAKEMNELFITIQTKQMGEMEEEIVKCCGDGLILFHPIHSITHHSFPISFLLSFTKRNEPSVCKDSNKMNGSNGGGDR